MSQAQTVQTDQRAAALDKLIACRGLADSTERLACFDRESGSFDQAERAGDLVVVDRQQVQQARRALFGLSLPSFTLLDRSASPEPLDRVTTTIRSARRNAADDWVFELEDGSIWRQVDSENLGRRPVPGSPVLVRRGAIGTYFLSVDGARSLRVRREQ